MLDIYRRYARTFLDLLLIVLSVFLILFLFSTFYRIAAPIFFGVIIYAMIEPLAAWLHRRRIKKPTAALISVLVFLVVIATILALGGLVFSSQVEQLSGVISQNEEVFRAAFITQLEWVQAKVAALPPGLVGEIETYVGKLVESGSALLSDFLLWIFRLISSVPTLLFNLVVGLILAFYLSSEINVWRDWADRSVPNTIKAAYTFLRVHVFSGISRYVRSLLVLVTLTFLLVFFGLLLIGVENAFSIAVLAALFDVLPILGIPVIFVPWITYCFILGDIERGIWLTVLLAVVFLTRQILEPKIAGDSLGVSAFIMLASMVVSLSLFGVAGVIITPFLVILIKALYEQKYFHRWIHLPADEFEKGS